MFAFNIATILAVAAVAFAHPSIKARGGGDCSTGELQCCASIAPSNSTNSASLGGLIPIALQGLNVPIGVNCLPISVLGLGSAGTCSSQAACCSGVDNTGTIPIGIDCSPINVGL